MIPAVRWTCAITLALDFAGASPGGAVESMVRSGYNIFGDWQGKGITSSVAALDGNYPRRRGQRFAGRAVRKCPGGPSFAGLHVNLTTVLVKFTHPAHINFDGVITPDDSAIFGGFFDETLLLI